MDSVHDNTNANAIADRNDEVLPDSLDRDAAAALATADAHRRLAYVSGNAEKRVEAERIAADADIDLVCMALPPGSVLPEVQGTVEAIARQKCLAAYAALGRPVVVEDIALCFDALGGLPGPYARDFLASRSLADVHALVAPATAPSPEGRLGVTVVSALAFTFDGDDVRIAVGRARGFVRDPALHAHLPAWYPLVERDRDDDASLAAPCDAWPCAADCDVPCLHRVRAFASLAQSLADAPPAPAPIDRRALPVTPAKMARMADATRTLLACLGEDVRREGLLDTPMRVAKAMVERTRGHRMTLAEAIGDALFAEASGEMVIVRDVDFFSMCEHHLLPFMGKAHVGYLPTGRIIGLSKIPRIVDMFSDRFQVQEALTRQIAECIGEATGARGVGVVIEGQHMCMCMRGVRKTGSATVTRVLLGDMRDDPVARKEFLALARPAVK